MIGHDLVINRLQGGAAATLLAMARRRRDAAGGAGGAGAAPVEVMKAEERKVRVEFTWFSK